MEERQAATVGAVLKRQRLMMSSTLQDIARKSGISPSYLLRIERGERFPSGRILRKLAKPLGFDETELFMLAGYLSCKPDQVTADGQPATHYPGLDPYVASVLAKETVETQRAIVGILSIMKGLSKSL